MGNDTISDYLKNGLTAQRAGNLTLALHLYNHIMEIDVENPAANFNTGLIKLEKKTPKEAVVYFYRAISSRPDIPNFWYKYIETLISLGDILKVNEAIAQTKLLKVYDDYISDLEQKVASIENLRQHNRSRKKSTTVSEKLKPIIKEAGNLCKKGELVAAAFLLQDTLDFPKNKYVKSELQAIYKLIGKSDGKI